MIDKNKFIDAAGRPLTQGIFLEYEYNQDYAIYTSKEQDHDYKGHVYPSLKRLYLQMEDPVEYDFVTKHLYSWGQWKRLLENKWCRKQIDEWREELDLKLRSRAVRDLQEMCGKEGGNYQAAKWLADRGWDKRAAGRPTKKEMERQIAIAQHIEDDFKSDVARMEDFRKN